MRIAASLYMIVIMGTIEMTVRGKLGNAEFRKPIAMARAMLDWQFSDQHLIA